jgi:hypothetical protein
MTPGAGRVKADATNRDGPPSAPSFPLEGKGNKEHGKEMTERSKFNIALVKNDLAVCGASCRDCRSSADNQVVER